MTRLGFYIQHGMPDNRRVVETIWFNSEVVCLEEIQAGCEKIYHINDITQQPQYLDEPIDASLISL